MNYRDVYKKMCAIAADHLYSLEPYGDFDEEDEERVDQALHAIQQQLWRKAGTDEKEGGASG